MGTLLRDMPEFAERIEGSYLLGESIKDCLSNIQVDVAPDHEFENDCITAFIQELKGAMFLIDENGMVQIDDRQSLGISIYGALKKVISEHSFDVFDKGRVADNDKESLVDFVNQNYTWKGESTR